MIVSDASPLIVLSRVGRLEWLSALYGQVHIPPAVRDEAMRRGVSPADLDNAPWLSVRAVRDGTAVEQLRDVDRLDPGESEAIVLAGELGLRLIMDERRGYQVARERGIVVFGTAHVVVEAAWMGLISADEVEPLLRGMVAGTFWLSERIIRLATAQARDHRP